MQNWLEIIDKNDKYLQVWYGLMSKNLFESFLVVFFQYIGYNRSNTDVAFKTELWKCGAWILINRVKVWGNGTIKIKIYDYIWSIFIKCSL